jgi:hypothetical protein
MFVVTLLAGESLHLAHMSKGEMSLYRFYARGTVGGLGLEHLLGSLDGLTL